MGDDRGRILLERRGDRNHRDLLLDRRGDLQRIAHHRVELARGEKLEAIDLWSARPDRHVEPVLLVGAFRDRLVEAAMFGLREPVGGKDDSLGRLRGGDAGREEQGGGKKTRDDSGHRNSGQGEGRKANPRSRDYAQVRSKAAQFRRAALSVVARR
jgi:hypothetical protein